MTPRWAQETGIADSLTPAGPPNGSLVKAAGAGMAVLLTTFKDGLSSVMPWAVFVLWLSWMVLGTARAMAQGEKFCASKAMGGAWRLIGAGAIWMTGLMGEAILAEQGQDLPLATGVLAWVAVTFCIRSADAASYFFPGLRTFLEKAAPKLFAQPAPPAPPLVPPQEAPQ